MFSIGKEQEQTLFKDLRRLRNSDKSWCKKIVFLKETDENFIKRAGIPHPEENL